MTPLELLANLDHAVIEEAIKDSLPRRFDTSIWKVPTQHGGMRETRIVGRGLNGTAWIKWDKLPISEHGVESYLKGNSTEKDILILEGRSMHSAPSSLSRILHADTVNVGGVDIQYLVEETYSGENLSERISRGPLGKQEFIDTFNPLVEGLRHYVQKEGILHRDIQPGNIMLEETGPVIIDWGHAKSIDDILQTSTGTVGKRSTADPTQFPELTERPGKYSIGSELWSWGATMLSAATGKPLYELKQEKGIFRAEGIDFFKDGKIDADRWNKYIAKKIEGASALNEKTGRVIQRMLTLNHEARYKNVEEFERDWKKATKPHFLQTTLGRVAAGFGTLLVGATAAVGMIQEERVKTAETRLEQERLTTTIIAETKPDLAVDGNYANNLELLVSGSPVEQDRYRGGVRIFEPDRERIALDMTGIEGARIGFQDSTFVPPMPRVPAQIRIDGFLVENVGWDHDIEYRPGVDVGQGYTRMAQYIDISELPDGIHKIAYTLFPSRPGARSNGNHDLIQFGDDGLAIGQRTAFFVKGDVTPENQFAVTDVGNQNYTPVVEVTGFTQETRRNSEVKIQYRMVDVPGSQVHTTDVRGGMARLRDLERVDQFHESLIPKFVDAYAMTKDYYKSWKAEKDHVESLERNPIRTLEVAVCVEGKPINVNYFRMRQNIITRRDGFPLPVRGDELGRHWVLERPDQTLGPQSIGYRRMLDQDPNTCQGDIS